MPRVECVIDGYVGEFRSLTDIYEHCVVFVVPDSREGWAQAREKIEAKSFQGDKRDQLLILDFSVVRPEGSPIMGMQGRTSSGPAHHAIG
jgi:hypothetical protein